jgi:hypothetical protein
LTFRLTTRPGHPTFTDLPWEQHLEDWESGRLVTPVRGISRHVVRFVAYGPDMYALKELPDPIAEREYRLLRELADRSVPVVEAVGVATGRTDRAGDVADGILITRHLPFSLPYRTLFGRRANAELWPQMLDALVQLLVRVHLAGFFWGDCSLNNSLFRRDAGALAAYLVDAETGELHHELSAGQRRHDLDIAEENIAGDLYDLQAAGQLDESVDPARITVDLRSRYINLWAEVTRDEVLPSADRWFVDERVNRLNDLGFDVSEIELVDSGDGWHLHLTTQVVEPGHHRRRLLALTGLDVGENQARRLLNDIGLYRARLERRTGQPVAEQVGALRWLTEVFEPTLSIVPEDERGKLEDAELFHQILEHRWFRSEQSGHDIGREAAVTAYVEEVLKHQADEAVVLDPGTRASTELPAD